MSRIISACSSRSICALAEASENMEVPFRWLYVIRLFIGLSQYTIGHSLGAQVVGEADITDPNSGSVWIQAGIGGVVYMPATITFEKGLDAGLSPLPRFNQRFFLATALGLGERTFVRIGVSLVGLPFSYEAALPTSYDTTGALVWEEGVYQMKQVFMDRYQFGAGFGMKVKQTNRWRLSWHAGVEAYRLSDFVFSSSAGEFIRGIYAPYIDVILEPIQGWHLSVVADAAVDYRMGARHSVGLSFDICYAPQVILQGRYWTGSGTTSEGHGSIEQRGSYAGFNVSYTYSW